MTPDVSLMSTVTYKLVHLSMNIVLSKNFTFSILLVERFGIKSVQTPSRLATAVSEGFQRNSMDESNLREDPGSPSSSDSSD